MEINTDKIIECLKYAKSQSSVGVSAWPDEIDDRTITYCRKKGYLIVWETTGLPTYFGSKMKFGPSLHDTISESGNEYLSNFELPNSIAH